MAAIFKARISAAVKNLAKIKGKVDLEDEPGKELSATDNANILEASLDRIRAEISRGESSLSQIQQAMNEWSAALKGLNRDEKAEEVRSYEQFQQAEKLTTKMEEAETRLVELRDLKTKTSAWAKNQRDKADRDQRAEMREHAQQMAAFTQRTQQVPQQAASQQAFPTLYQLPTLQIKPFKGDKREWPAFEEAFRAAIDSKQGTNTEKLNLLRTLLQGEPETLIAGLRLEDDNYPVAKNLLKETYGERGAYVRTLYSELTNLRPCSNLEDTRQFLLELERLARELDTAGEEIEGPSVYLVLEKKLNKNFLRTILMKKEEDPSSWSTTKFRQTLKEAIRRETTIQDVMAEFGFEKKSKQQKEQEQSRGQGGFIRAEHTAATQAHECAFCGGEHWPDKCQEYKTCAQRYARAKEKNLCYRCLRTGHSRWNCSRPAKCYKCRKAHPTALCQEKKESEDQMEQVASLLARKSPQQREDFIQMLKGERKCNSTKDESRQDCNAIQDEGTRVLLMTLECTIFNPRDPKKSMVAVVFIDPGAQRSFISTEAAEKLGITGFTKEECYLSSFGDRQPRRYMTERVRLGFLCHGGDPMVISITKMKFLLNEMAVVKVNQMDEEKLQRPMLEWPTESKKPDILLGMDVWHHLQINGHTGLPNGFTLCTSRLGRIISGKGQININGPIPDCKVTFVMTVFEDAKGGKQKSADQSGKWKKKAKHNSSWKMARTNQEPTDGSFDAWIKLRQQRKEQQLSAEQIPGALQNKCRSRAQKDCRQVRKHNPSAANFSEVRKPHAKRNCGERKEPSAERRPSELRGKCQLKASKWQQVREHTQPAEQTHADSNAKAKQWHQRNRHGRNAKGPIKASSMGSKESESLAQDRTTPVLVKKMCQDLRSRARRINDDADRDQRDMAARFGRGNRARQKRTSEPLPPGVSRFHATDPGIAGSGQGQKGKR